MGNGKRAALVGFKGYLLRQHDVAGDEVAIRNEAPFANVLARAAEFLDVGLRAMVNPIARPGVAADDVEIPESLVAGALLRREPALAPRFRSGTIGCTIPIAPPPAKALQAARYRTRRGQTSPPPGRSAGSPSSAADEARVKQRFLRRWIKGADNPLLAGPRSNRRRKACAGQILETPLGLFELR